MIKPASSPDKTKKVRLRARIETLASLQWLAQKSFLKDAVCLANMRKIRAVMRRMMISDGYGNVLLNAFLQTLQCMSSVSTVAVAQKLIYDIAVVMGRQYILLD